MSTWRITVEGVEGAVEIEVPNGWELVTTEHFRRLQGAVTLLSDLDRSPNGRHKGDVESQDPSGISQGNPYLVPGQRIGTDISGRPITVPAMEAFTNLADASLWRAEA